MNVPLFELTVGTIFQGEGHLGDVLKALRRQFEEAAAAAPSILLIDELDSFSRRDVKDNNQSFAATVINELLTLVDGATSRRPGLVIIGSTNMPDAVEPELRRPGRISRTIKMTLPGAAGRENVMRFHLRDELLGQSIAEAVRLSAGLTSASLMDATRRARQAARSGDRPMTPEDLDRAIVGDRTVEDTLLLRHVAVHEAGHAIAAMVLPDGPILRSVSLMTEGSTLGRVRTWEREGPTTIAREEAKVAMILSGRAAEMLILGSDVSDGASRDLKLATEIVARMHAQFGMYGELVHHDSPELLLAQNPEFAKKVNDVLARLLSAAVNVLSDFKPEIVALGEELVARRFLTGDEAVAVMRHASMTRSSATSEA